MYRSSRPLSIWRELDRMQRDISRLFGGQASSLLHAAPSYPALNIWTIEDEQLITAEMPGMSSDDLKIEVFADSLSISGERQMPEELKDMNIHRRERNYGKFNRTIQLPFMVDTNKVEAKFSNGILQLTLPRAEADKPKKITVKSS